MSSLMDCVIVNFMSQLAWVKGNTISGCVMRVFLEEISIWIHI